MATATVAPEARYSRVPLFKPGQSGNPAGRPKGSGNGRAGALAILDKILGKESNKKLLEYKLEQEFKKNPVLFFRQIVMPLIPREHLVKEDRAEKAPIRILFNDAAAAADPDFQEAHRQGPDESVNDE